ncbi:MAG: hypothetical protein R3B13_26090 [Polyangiaceae bacterium]
MSRRARARALPVSWVVAFALGAWVSWSCGSGDESRPPANPPADAGADASGEDGAADAPLDASQDAPDAISDAPNDASCAVGSEKECKVLLPPQGNVQNCFVGVQYCDDGTWSSCQTPRDS